MLTAAERAAMANFRTALRDEVDAVFGPAADAVNGTAAPTTALKVGQEITIPFLLPDAATTTYRYMLPDKCEIIDVTCIKDAAGAGNTIQVKNSAGTAISDAIAAAVDKTVTRAGTLDKATRVIAAAGEIQITNTRAAGSSACAVFVKAIRRA